MSLKAGTPRNRAKSDKGVCSSACFDVFYEVMSGSFEDSVGEKCFLCLSSSRMSLLLEFGACLWSFQMFHDSQARFDLPNFLRGTLTSKWPSSELRTTCISNNSTHYDSLSQQARGLSWPAIIDSFSSGHKAHASHRINASLKVRDVLFYYIYWAMRPQTLFLNSSCCCSGLTKKGGELYSITLKMQLKYTCRRSFCVAVGVLFNTLYSQLFIHFVNILIVVSYYRISQKIPKSKHTIIRSISRFQHASISFLWNDPNFLSELFIK